MSADQPAGLASLGWSPCPDVSLHNDRVAREDAERQERTAVEVIRRLNHQPGVILADEVGMGKTFVALAVAVGVAVSTRRRRPVVVMVPPAVADKWPRDWEVFREKCLPGDFDIRATSSTVSRGSEFLKLLDDPASRRHHIIFMKHGALRASLNDPFLRLAAVRQAFRGLRDPDLKARKTAFPRWAGDVVGDRWFTPERAQQFLDSPPERWMELCDDRPSITDDPVPGLFIEALGDADLTDLRQVLRSLPLRDSSGLSLRLVEARRQLKAPMDALWREVIGNMRLEMPLLILDEAHHLKNPNQLASLFTAPEEETTGIEGALYGAFRRMLFLTATPFQLGHRELIRVIDRFDAVRMTSSERAAVVSEREHLAAALDRSQGDVIRLESTWARLRPDDLGDLGPGWWSRDVDALPESVRPAAAAAQAARQSFLTAQTALAPWVLRHRRVHRRDVIGGDGILPDSDRHGGSDELRGLGIGSDATLPFLLAARAEAMLSVLDLRGHSGTRAIFSDGLASSYDTFRHRDTVGADDEESEGPPDDLPSEFRWYLEQIDQFIPRDDQALLDRHPKIEATTARVLDLWKRGEKTLIFVFYRATGHALRRSISTAIDAEIESRARRVDLTVDQLRARSTGTLGSDGAAARSIGETLGELAKRHRLPEQDTEELNKVVLRFLRTPEFQARFLLDSADLPSALDSVLSASAGGDLRARLDGFIESVARLGTGEREQLWLDLKAFQTGRRRTGPDDLLGLEADRANATVRLANGATDADTRRRLMQTFNTPFFPEVLIASSVMAEGVDLHRDCRHVIHHDLDWNPSVLEQRAGRVDRVGSLAERTGHHIQVFEPFLAATQDERVYRVVKDRERWFNVIMGGAGPLTLREAEQVAQRVPLPDDLLAQLTFHLEA